MASCYITSKLLPAKRACSTLATTIHLESYSELLPGAVFSLLFVNKVAGNRQLARHTNIVDLTLFL